MKNLLDSKIAAWSAFLLVILLIALTVVLRVEWWDYIDILFAFLMAFCHLLAVYFRKIPDMSRKLDLAALVCGITSLVALIVLAIV